MIKSEHVHSAHHCQRECDNCNERLDFLRALDFAIQETVLYLDAYPHCQAALEYYHKLMEQRAQAVEAYEKHCAPLTMYGNQSHTSWDWVKGPWPWEFDAN
jgi:spore coat protein JB